MYRMNDAAYKMMQPLYEAFVGKVYNSSKKVARKYDLDPNAIAAAVFETMHTNPRAYKHISKSRDRHMLRVLMSAAPLPNWRRVEGRKDIPKELVLVAITLILKWVGRAPPKYTWSILIQVAKMHLDQFNEYWRTYYKPLRPDNVKNQIDTLSNMFRYWLITNQRNQAGYHFMTLLDPSFKKPSIKLL